MHIDIGKLLRLFSGPQPTLTAWHKRYRNQLSSITEAVSKEARWRLDSRESDEALEHIAIATEERAVANREERDKRQKKAEDEKARLDRIPQQTDLAWPRTKGVTNIILKDQLKDSLVTQYFQAVGGWNRKQTEPEGGSPHAAQVPHS